MIFLFSTPSKRVYLARSKPLLCKTLNIIYSIRLYHCACAFAAVVRTLYCLCVLLKWSLIQIGEKEAGIIQHPRRLSRAYNSLVSYLHENSRDNTCTSRYHVLLARTCNSCTNLKQRKEKRVKRKTKYKRSLTIFTLFDCNIRVV